MSLEVHVKEEPERKSDGDSRGTSEAARVGPFVDHEFKSELVTPPEAQQPPCLLLANHAFKEGEYSNEGAEHLKTEPDWGESPGPRGVSEAAARTGLYPGHIVKDELVLGPERLQPRDAAFSLRAFKEGECSNEGAEHLKTEPDCGESPGPRGVSEAAARAGLYPGHVVKDELVLGPERLQPRDATFSLRAASEQAAGVSGGGGQLVLRDSDSRRSPTSDTAGTKISNLKTRKQIHTGEKLHACEICNKKYKNSSSLFRHKFVHTERKPLAFRICYREYKQKGQSICKSMYSCAVCDKMFMGLSNLNNHTLIHTGHKPYSCEICNKQFTLKGTLKKHELIHTGERPFACDICERRFTQKVSLNNHKRKLHTAVKPYSCEICKKEFRKNSVLQTHMLTHSESKPHSCDICDKKYKHLRDLERHKLIHTGEKPYACEVCEKRFPLLDSLKKHHTIVHKSSNIAVGGTRAGSGPIATTILPTNLPPSSSVRTVEGGG